MGMIMERWLRMGKGRWTVKKEETKRMERWREKKEREQTEDC